MKTFFILYWLTFIVGYIGVRSYLSYYRRNVLRHEYAQRHRRRLNQGHARTPLERNRTEAVGEAGASEEQLSFC